MYKKFKLELGSYSVNYSHDKIIATAHYNCVDIYNEDENQRRNSNWSTNIEYPLGTEVTESMINESVLKLTGVVQTS